MTAMRNVVALLALICVSGCATTPARWPAAERPRARAHATFEYASTSGARRPVDIAYFVVGRGPALYVLIHGMDTNADSWARVVDGMAANGRVVAMDLPGCGESGVPEDFVYDLPGLADVAAQVVRRAPELV